MLILGLTGSIGMGKTATAAMIRRRGVPVHDADAAVHALYAGPAVAAIEAAFPGTIVEGRVDRARLAARVLGDEERVRRLETIVHPLVRQAETAFLARCREEQRRLAVLDVPLLLETGLERRCDLVVVVSAASPVQRERVLGRPGMTETRFAALLARQMPDADKRGKAHAVIRTDQGFASTERQVDSLLRALAALPGQALSRGQESHHA